MVHTSESRQQWMVNQGRLPRMMHLAAQLKQSQIFEEAYVPSRSNEARQITRLDAIPRQLGVSQPDNHERPPSKRARRVSKKINYQADREGWGPTIAQPNARQTPNGTSNGWGGEVYTVSRYSTLPPEQQDHVHEFRDSVQLRTSAPAALHSQLASLESPHDQTDASYIASRTRGMT